MGIPRTETRKVTKVLSSQVWSHSAHTCIIHELVISRPVFKALENVSTNKGTKVAFTLFVAKTCSSKPFLVMSSATRASEICKLRLNITVSLIS